VTEILTIATADVAPAREAVLAQLGIPPLTALAPRTEGLLEAAAALFAEHVAPAGVVSELPPEVFAQVYRGEGRNAQESPVPVIAGRAEHLALFAVTLGQGIGDALARLFAAEDFALAYTLDALASVAADGAAEVAERRFEADVRARRRPAHDTVALRYSPGYCGWDVTGQRRLFAALHPERIGLTLTDSCLMQPLKSVSGVLIAGPRDIHRFPPTYDFCDRCEVRTCRDRLVALFTGARA
jgi:hypothetical protein